MQQTSTGGAGFLDGSAFYREIAIQPWVCFSTAFVEPDAKAELRR